MKLGKLVGAAVSVATALTLLVPPSVAAPAASADGDREQARRASTVSDYQSGYRMAWVDKFNLCLGVYMRATVKATMTTSYTVGGTPVYKLHSPRLVDPYMLVTTKRSCDDSSLVKRRHSINKLTHRMMAYGYKCSYDPSYSVGFPWSVGVGATPDCGNERVAQFGQTQGRARRKYRFELVTEGFAMGWDQSDGDVGPGYDLKLCTSVSGFLRMKDSSGAQVATVVKRVGMPDFCVHKKS